MNIPGLSHVTLGNDPHIIVINPKNDTVYVTDFGGGEGITTTQLQKLDY
jgi:DNA-binding beta-propeller fold protein YncE